MLFISLTAGVYILFTGGRLSADVTAEIGYAVFGTVIDDELSLTAGQALTIAVVLPFLTLCAFSMVQMILCFVMKPVNSFLVCFMGVLLSVYWSQGFVLGNGAMAVRSAVIADGGTPAIMSVIVALSVIVVSGLVGGVLFQHYDILKIGE